MLLCLSLILYFNLCETISALRHSLIELENPLYGGMFLMLLCLSLILYYLTCLTDPGFVAIAKYKKVSESNANEG